MKARSEGETVVVDVRDSGPGIADKDWPKIFRPFKRLDEAATSGIEGAGMGLYIVKKSWTCTAAT